MTIQNFLQNLSKEEIEKGNEIQKAETEKQYIEFKKSLKNNECYLCDSKLNQFDENKPCLHLLLRPKELKKKYIKKLINSGVGFFRTTTYLRWLANFEAPFKNISNLKSETTKDKKFEQTIKYKNFEWSFTCSPGDYAGHKDKNYGKLPHFHMQMKINGQLFYKFGEDHIPFSKQDLFTIELYESDPKRVIVYNLYAWGMQESLDYIGPNKLMKTMGKTFNENEATYHLTTIVEASEGKTLKGDDIADILQESREKGIPVSRLASKLGGKQKTYISPGEGVPTILKRNKRKNK